MRDFFFWGVEGREEEIKTASPSLKFDFSKNHSRVKNSSLIGSSTKSVECMKVCSLSINSGLFISMGVGKSRVKKFSKVMSDQRKLLQVTFAVRTRKQNLKKKLNTCAKKIRFDFCLFKGGRK